MIGRNTVATCFTIWSMRAGLPGDRILEVVDPKGAAAVLATEALEG